MLFNSLEFLLFFLAVTWDYFLLPKVEKLIQYGYL